MKHVEFRLGKVLLRLSYGDTKHEPVEAHRIVGVIPRAILPKAGSLDGDVRRIVRQQVKSSALK